MRFLSLRWRLAGAFFLIVFALVSALGLYLVNWSQAYYIEAVSNDLRRESMAAGTLAASEPGEKMPEAIARLGRDLGHRITIIGADGTVLADSERDYRKMSNHADRPEFRQALATGYGTATRYSSTLKTDMLYVATRSKLDSEIPRIVRVAEPLSGLDEIMSTVRRTFLLAGLTAILVAALLSLKLAAGVTSPLESIAAAARRLSQGDLAARVPAAQRPSAEIHALAETFNIMAEQLQAKIAEVTEQKARMQEVFDHTDDGLLVVGADGRIQMANPAACRMIGMACAEAVGKTIIEGTLSHDLATLVERTARTQEPGALDIALSAGDERHVHVYVAPMTHAGAQAGSLVVLHDTTESRRLDEMRQDFVANVSHEIRTPLASIKAMAETISLRHKDDPSAVPQFAESIVREADRMVSLADDLLDLAGIESGQRKLAVQDLNLRGLLEDVLSRVRSSSDEKALKLTMDVPGDLTLQADVDALIQVVLNLVDNAVKYSREGGRVSVSAAREGENVVIQVADNGIGIAEEDLPRVFERFYRVDRDRSRRSGGTGLGLSIAKHLVGLLGGSVSVTSRLGEGTTFTIKLPTKV